jgi:hypothetical protein
VWEQIEPHLIPAGLDVTFPVPLPAFLTVNVWELSAKVATTERAWPIVTVQVLVPLQAPDQPEKVEPLAGVAARVTLVPKAKSWEQVDPQLIPGGSELTVPVPAPALLTLRRWVSVGKTPTHG